MGLYDSIKAIVLDVINSLQTLKLDEIRSVGKQPLRMIHESGAELELRQDGKGYYNDSEISNIAGGGGDFMADGSVPMTGNLSMNNHDIANVNTVNGRVDTILQITSNYQTLRLNAVDGYDIVMGDPVAMGANKITGLGTPTADTDASTKGYVDGARTNTGAQEAANHGTAATDEIVNVCYGTSATPPTASGTTEGALYIQYTA